MTATIRPPEPACLHCGEPAARRFCGGTCAARYAASEQTWREQAAASERAAQIAARQRLDAKPEPGWGYPFPINGIGGAA